MDQRNLFIAIAISIAILIGFQYVAERFQPPPQPTEQAKTGAESGASAPGANKAPSGGVPAGAPSVAGEAKTAPRAQVLARSPRVAIDTPRLKGSINLIGGRIDDLTLTAYRETVDPKSPEIVLLAPDGSEHPYFLQFGWVAADPDVKVPGPDARWTSSGGTLTPGHPTDLTWDSGTGLKFTRHIALDSDYMFTITDRVTNSGSAAVKLSPYVVDVRKGGIEVSRTYLLHEGPIGVTDGRLHDGSCVPLLGCDPFNYDEMKKNAHERFATTGGWFGFTDKYWLTALVPPRGAQVTAELQYGKPGDVDVYQADYIGAAQEVAPGATVTEESRAFAGAKEVALLDRYETQYRIQNFDRAIDFGWFYWITKPIFLTLDFFYKLLGNFGLAILLLTVIIKLVFFPLANKSYRAMSKMKKLQPEMQKLREKFGDDKEKLNKETMALYKRVGANPMAGCLPIVIQIPVFFSLYKVLYVTIEMRHAPFYGWIHDLSAPDPTTFVNLFGLLPFAPPHIAFLPVSLLHIGVWPLIMGLTMFLQQKLNPQPPDPVQAKMFMILPVVFTFMLAQFAAGLVIYWSWNNLLSIAQQWVIMRRAGAA
ncbi:MAG: membrane protein insertase YidC [Alphaproteobacteria bacterium]|nr:membrane protein insertase YidC [Alphaproteobacteria bacterium]